MASGEARKRPERGPKVAAVEAAISRNHQSSPAVGGDRPAVMSKMAPTFGAILGVTANTLGGYNGDLFRHTRLADRAKHPWNRDRMTSKGNRGSTGFLAAAGRGVIR